MWYAGSMEVYSIGSRIREERLRLKISQEELSFDLCSTPTLSRIESGKQVPGRKLVEALFSKMGVATPTLNIPMTKADVKRSNLEYKITDAVAAGNYEIADFLTQYKDSSGDLDVLERQFYQFFKAIYDAEHGVAAETVIYQLETALRLSIKQYSIGQLPAVHYLTKTELMILNNIALTQYKLQQQDSAIRLMEFLRGYFESGIVLEEEKAKSYPVILFNLANWYGLRGNGEKALALSEIGIDVCIRYGKLTLFPYHLFNKGYSLALLERIDEARQFFQQAFNVFDAEKRHAATIFGAKAINEKFGFHFSTD